MKKIVCLSLAILIVVVFTVPAFAESAESYTLRGPAVPWDVFSFTYTSVAQDVGLEGQYTVFSFPMSTLNTAFDGAPLGSYVFSWKLGDIRLNDYVFEGWSYNEVAISKLRVTAFGNNSNNYDSAYNYLELSYVPNGTLIRIDLSDYRLNELASYPASITFAFGFYDMYGNLVGNPSWSYPFVYYEEEYSIFTLPLDYPAGAVYCLVQYVITWSNLGTYLYGSVTTPPARTELLIPTDYITSTLIPSIDKGVAGINDKLQQYFEGQYGVIPPNKKPQFDDNLADEEDILEETGGFLDSFIVGMFPGDSVAGALLDFFADLTDPFLAITYMFNLVVYNGQTVLPITPIYILVYVSGALGFIGLLIGFIASSASKIGGKR